MSCTENESGPFVIFFLPAVVACLTILLARRWVNSTVSSTSSTAVSRRRKIIKDPLVKRPLPPIACPKMVQPGSKKVGFAKKGSFPVAEEEMNGGGKRARPARLSPSSNSVNTSNDVKVSDGPVAPKHIPFPYIPQDGELLFEAMTFVFTLVATGLQFLNMYRTAWWLPHSYTTQAMNFYLIDISLVALITVLVSRRVLLCLLLAAASHCVPPKHLTAATNAIRMLTLGAVLAMLFWCTYAIVLKFPLVKIFYLCYPAIIYFILFGFKASPFLELGSGDAPLHCCSHDQNQIRQEVEVLKQDFNMRVKKIIFNSVEGAYYSSFIPLCFAQSFLSYDVYAAAQQVAFVWAGLFARYCSQMLSAMYCDVAHRAALHLQEQTSPDSNGENPSPTHTAVGVAMSWRYVRVWGRAAATTHVAEHARFTMVFSNPSMLLCGLLVMQMCFIALQMCLLFSNMLWHNFLSMFILLFINYYTVFKMVRDYLVAWKVYKAENMIHEKNYALNYPQN